MCLQCESNTIFPLHQPGKGLATNLKRGFSVFPICYSQIQNPATNSRNDHTDKEIREIENGEVPVLVPSLSGGEQGADFSPDLADVVAAWPDLPDAIKAGVLALVRAAIGKRPTDEG